MTERIAEILLIEDDPADVRLIEEVFRQGRIRNRLHVIMNGDEAIDYLIQCDNAPDLILLDLNLPGTDGREVLVEIKSNEKLKSIPVIVLTTSRSEDDLLRSYAQCVNSYVTKPIDPIQFIAIVKNLENFWIDIVRVPSAVPS